MADFTQSKQVFASQMQTVAEQLLQIAEQLDELDAAYGVHGFAANGAHPIVDGDFATSNTHLSAAICADVMFAIGTVSGALTTGVKNSLRECLLGGLA